MQLKHIFHNTVSTIYGQNDVNVKIILTNNKKNQSLLGEFKSASIQMSEGSRACTSSVSNSPKFSACTTLLTNIVSPMVELHEDTGSIKMWSFADWADVLT
jgi:hypothetical protein